METSIQTEHITDDKAADRFEAAKRYRRQARIAQADNRAEMATDEDYYDSIQMEPEDLNILLGRDQPPLVYNITKNVTNWIIGLEQNSRIDDRVLPRRKSEAGNAKTKTKALKYIDDCSYGAMVRSAAFASAAKAGIGWLETGARQTDEVVFLRYERWRNMWYDHLSTAIDYRDMRYVWRERWTDLDYAQAMFPDKAEDLAILCDSVNSLYPWRAEDAPVVDVASEFDMDDGLGYYGCNGDVRERIKLIEMQYRVPAKVQIMNMRDKDTPFGALNGVIYRPKDEDHSYLVRGGHFTLSDALKITVRHMMWTGGLLLQDILTPYNHNRFSFVPIFCYRRERDNMTYGVIRDFRDPQNSLNKRKSKSLFLMSANQYQVEKGSVNNIEKFRDEGQRPDGVQVINDGKMGMVKKVEHTTEIAEHNAVAKDDERFIYSIAGVAADADFQQKKDMSGVAIEKMENQSTQSHGVLFTNHFHALQLIGELKLSNLEQFWDKEKEFRITGDQQKDEFITANKPNDDGTIEDSIIANKSDYVLSKQNYRDTLRKSATEQLLSLIGTIAKATPKGADVALNILDLMVDMMDELWNKDEIVSRIRKINKQHAPDDEMNDQEKAETQKAQQAMQQEQQMMKQLQMAAAQAKVQFEQAKALNEQTKAFENKASAALKKLDAFMQAVEVAQSLMVTPQVAQAADVIIAEAQTAGDNQQQQNNSQGGQ